MTKHVKIEHCCFFNISLGCFEKRIANASPTPNHVTLQCNKISLGQTTTWQYKRHAIILTNAILARWRIYTSLSFEVLSFMTAVCTKQRVVCLINVTMHIAPLHAKCRCVTIYTSTTAIHLSNIHVDSPFKQLLILLSTIRHKPIIHGLLQYVNTCQCCDNVRNCKHINHNYPTIKLSFTLQLPIHGPKNRNLLVFRQWKPLH